MGLKNTKGIQRRSTVNRSRSSARLRSIGGASLASAHRNESSHSNRLLRWLKAKETPRHRRAPIVVLLALFFSKLKRRFVRKRQDIGAQGEMHAENFLCALRYQIAERNWRCPRGEIDLIAIDGTELVFVEVKTRTSNEEEIFANITAKKASKLKVLAQIFLQERFRSAPWPQYRIDLIGVFLSPDRDPQISYVKNALSDRGV